MRDAATLLGAVDSLMGLLFIALAIPLIGRRVRMNAWYGVRIPKAFRSEENWYAINEFGGKVLAVSGLLIALVGVATLVLEPASPAAILILALAPAPILLLALVPIYRFARKLP